MQVIKESSDSIDNSSVPAKEHVSGKRSLSDYIALGIATCGVGYIPVAPGTWGSGVGVIVYLFLQELSARTFISAQAHGWDVPPLESFRTSFILVFLIFLTIVGIKSSSRIEPLLGRKDPGIVVIDEVVGQLITFLFIPFNSGFWTIMVGFLVFRVFDIWKPYPIRRLEALESGLGIMADDVLAGAYAATFMSILTSIYLLF
jgi:phosphatidylglycerophosphatase A